MRQAGGRTPSSVPLLFVPTEGSIALVATTDELTGMEIVQQSFLIVGQTVPESPAKSDVMVYLGAAH